MVKSEADSHRLSLIVLRLMDGDLLNAQEGAALLSDVDALQRPQPDANPTSVPARVERLISTFEALAQTGRLDLPTLAHVQEIVHRSLRGACDPCGLSSARPGEENE